MTPTSGFSFGVGAGRRAIVGEVVLQNRDPVEGFVTGGQRLDRVGRKQAYFWFSVSAAACRCEHSVFICTE